MHLLPVVTRHPESRPKELRGHIMLTLASRLPFHSWLLLESEGPLRRHMIILPETHA